LQIFGENLRALRTEKGLSQRALFALCGIDNGMISRMENGTVNVTLSTLKSLADALGVPPWRLLFEEEKKVEEEKIDLDNNTDVI
jgi:transcriptional regulator with XRE-family HTH domain